MSVLMETEAQLSAMPPAQKWGVIFLIVLLIAGGGWYFWVADLYDEIEQADSAITSLQSKIRRNNVRLYNHKIAAMKKKNLLLKSDIEAYRSARRFLQSRAERYDFLWFKEKNFVRMLERTLARSTALGLRIDRVESIEESGKLTPLIARRDRLRIEGAGRFKEIERLARYIESFEALLKIDHLHVWYDEEKQETRFSLELQTYGLAS